MRLKLKKFRVEAGLTQAKLASAVGVTQPNYQRWETGAAPIPADKLKKLAKVLKVGPETLLGRHPPVRAKVYDDSEGKDLDYYGEVAVHFHGSGKNLLVSISEDEYERLHHDLQSGSAFVHVESLANQLVILRKKAITDLYFSSEAYDDYGPEAPYHGNCVQTMIPDPRDWEIIESLAVDGVGLEDFDQGDIKRVQELIMMPESENDYLENSNLPAVYDNNNSKTEEILDIATKIKIQFTNGTTRNIHIIDDCCVYEAFSSLIEFPDDEGECDMIRLSTDGYHRTIFVGRSTFDYIMMPSHKYKNGEIEAAAASLDAFN